MGALHEGHLRLIDRARKVSGQNGRVIATIFVNPTQFGPREDYRQYPRSFREDCAKLRARGCDVLFAPTVEDMYRPDRSVTIQENRLSEVMCGLSRPGHFSGVCTVVAKLFHLTAPDVAIFGQKDFQQFVIVRRMVCDLDFTVRLIAHPIVREADGLALSSRNTYLSASERVQAPIVHRALREAAVKVQSGFRGVTPLERFIRSRIQSAPAAKIDYVAVVDPETLERKSALTFPILLAAAVYFGSTRLIDNVLLRRPGSGLNEKS